jgi:hypothetical protein
MFLHLVLLVKVTELGPDVSERLGLCFLLGGEEVSLDTFHAKPQHSSAISYSVERQLALAAKHVNEVWMGADDLSYLLGG